MQRPSVGLPHPDSPTRPSVSPRAISRSTPSTARSMSWGRRVSAPISDVPIEKCISKPRTSSSGSATGDHRLLLDRPGGSLVVDAGGAAAGRDLAQRLVADQAVGLRELAARREPAAVGGIDQV